MVAGGHICRRTGSIFGRTQLDHRPVVSECDKEKKDTGGRTDGWTPDGPLWDKPFLSVELKKNEPLKVLTNKLYNCFSTPDKGFPRFTIFPSANLGSLFHGNVPVMSYVPIYEFRLLSSDYLKFFNVYYIFVCGNSRTFISM